MTDVHDSMVSVGGCKIRVLRKGSGQPFLFLHGARGGGVWQPFMEQLSKRFDVIVPEHPGFGASDDPEWLDSMDDLAFFYLEVLKQFDLENVHLCGNSLGGWLALEIAMRSCERIACMTLVSPAGILVPEKPPADIFLWSNEKLTRNLFANPAIVEAALKMSPPDQEVRAQLKNKNTVAKLAWNPRFHNPDLRKWLHLIDVPCQVLWGRDDKLTSCDYAEEFKKLIPRCQTAIFDQCGHLPHAEKMPAFVAAVENFDRQCKP